MKTSFTKTGKLKLVLFLTLCAVIFGCAVLLCFNTINKNAGTAETPEATQTEITAPELNATATAKTSLTIPVITASDKYTISGRTATAIYDGSTISMYIGGGTAPNAPYGISGEYDGTQPIHLDRSAVGSYSFTLYIRDTDSYQWSDGTTTDKTYTLIIKTKINIPAITASDDYTVSGRTATTVYTGATISMYIQGGVATNSPYDIYGDYNGTQPIHLDRSAVGSYSFTLYIKDTTCYYWSDNTTTPKTYTLTIQSNMSNVTVGTISSTAYVYDGTEKQPEPTVKDGTTTLKKGTHYTLSYENNINAGTTAKLIVTGIGSYGGEKKVNFTINQRDISNASFGTISTQYYTGSEVKPEPTITDKVLNPNVTLRKNTDFTFSYESNINAGTATIKITGTDKGNYKGTKSTTFAISGKSVAGAEISDISSYTYDGTAKKPTATVTLDGVTLASGTDFDFSWSNNVNAGQATLTITGKGNYAGTENKQFTIDPRGIADAEVADIAAQPYTGSAKTPVPTLTDLSKTLTKDKDYTLSYTDNIDVGTATITITGAGNYTGTKEVTFSITPRSIANATTSAIETYYYDGNAKEPTPTVTDGSKTLEEGVDYSITYADNVNVGTAKIILSGMGNYSGTKEVNFSIQPPTVDNAEVTLSQTTYTYDGSAKTPRVTSVSVASLTLREGIDYTVSYSSNVNAGTAKVIITGAGDYAGTKEVTFTINPADIAHASLSGLQIQYDYTGSDVEPQVTVTFDGKELVKNTDYLVAYTDNVDVGTATVTVTGSRNYTGTLTDTFAIVRASISPATVTGINATYGYTGSAITPTPVVNWNGIVLVKDTDYTVSYDGNTDLGTATVTIAGLGNFKGTITKTFEIVAADISTAQISGIDANYTYTGSAITPAPTVTLGDKTLVKDVDYTVAYTANINKGTATLTVTGKGNYTGSVSATFEIGEADMNDATVTGIDEEYEYTGSAITPDPTVALGTVTLVKDVDYTVAYSSNVDLGTATVTITGKGNFNAVITVTFEIVKADIANAVITGVDEKYEYTGSAITPAPVVTLGDKTLVKDVDYTVTYVSNTDLGNAVINLTGIGNYTGVKSTGFKIVVAESSDATVTGIEEEYEWTGSAITPDPTVTLNGVTLVKDTDFTIAFTDNTEVGTASYVITFTGNYSGSISGEFEIIKAKPQVTVEYTDYDGVSALFVGKDLPKLTATATYNGATVEGTVSWDAQDPTLKEGQQKYTWTFTPADEEHYAVVTGDKTLSATKPNYYAIRAEWKNGTQPELFTSTPLSVIKQNLKVTGLFNDGTSDDISGGYTFTINAANGTVYTSMPTKGGNDFSITVTFGTLSCTDLVAVEIKDVVLTGLSVDPADGDEIAKDYTALDKFDASSVVVTAKYSDGSEKTVQAGKGGYTVIYENGTEFKYGDTKVTLSYTVGGVTKTAEIEDIAVSKKTFDSALLTFKPEDRDYDFGNTLTGNIAVENMPDWLKVTYVYTDAKGNVIDAASVKNAGTYKVTAKFTVDDNHEQIADIIATFTINKLEPKLSPAVGGSFAVGTTLSELTISANNKTTGGTLTWDDSTYKLQSGINRCYYTFTPDDTVNFSVVHGYVDIASEGAQKTVTEGGDSLLGWQIALIIISAAVVIISIVALVIALKSRNNSDDDGFYDEVTEADLAKY